MTSDFQLLTVSEAASLLRISVKTLYGWVYQRRIPFRKHGAKLMFMEGELVAWSEAQRVRPGESCGSSVTIKRSETADDK